VEEEKEKEKRYLSITEVAEILSVSRPTVRNMIKDGKLAAIRAGRRLFRIPSSDLQMFIDEQLEDGPK